MSLQGREGRLELRGRVLDAAGRALASAQVSSFYALDEGSTALAKVDGSFELSVQAGQSLHLLRAAHPGYAECKLWLREVDAGHAVELRLQSAGSVQGRVICPKGQPIPGAEVSRPPSWTRTDADGQFQIDDLPAGEGLLRVYAKDWGALQYPVQVVAGKVQADLVIVLPAGRSIMGRLRSEGGEAVRSALVSARVPGLRSSLRSTFSDADGAFQLADLPADLRVLEFSGPGFATFSVAVPESGQFLEIVVTRATGEISLQSGQDREACSSEAGSILREDQ